MEIEMTDSTSRALHEDVCEYKEDLLIPIQEERLRSVVQEMTHSCREETTIDHVGAA